MGSEFFTTASLSDVLNNATVSASDAFTNSTASPPLEDWPLGVRVAVPIISVLSFFVVQVIMLFVRDPEYKTRSTFHEDAEFGGVLMPPFCEGPLPEEKTVQAPSLPKSSSTSCHIKSREELRQSRTGRRTMSESDVIAAEMPRSSETQAYLQGVLRCPVSRRRLASTSSSTGTSEEGAIHVATFSLSFGRRSRRARSQSTGEVGHNSPGLLENYRMTSGGNLDANQMTISSIKEENEFGSRDYEATKGKNETRF